MAKSVDKPIRLYVLAIFVVVAYGLMPFVSVFFVSKREAFLVGLRTLPFNGSILFLYDAEGNANIVLIFVSLFLCIFSAASAIWAFYGDVAGRIATLLFVTLNVVWWTGIVLYAIANGENDAPDKLGWIFQLIVPPIWLGFIWWNFTRSDINAYYKFKSESK
ncbi:MAG: hypothetical protein WBD27_08580 [Pyrinomonadaceae bacterium]